MKIYITGVSGTGKTSIARELNARGIPAVDMDELCHWEHLESKKPITWEPGKNEEWHEQHGWVCNVGALEEFLAVNEDAVAVGLSSNQEEYLPFFDKVLVLQSKPEVIVERINARTDNEYGKHPAEQGRILGWHKTFETGMRERGATLLNADRPLTEVVDEVESYFKR